MSENAVWYWKRLWRWTTSESLKSDEILSLLGKKEVIEGLRQGITGYKPYKPDVFTQLQSKYSEQTKLLSVVQSLQYHIDVDCFQVWDILMYYLCDISCGTPENALKNVAFVDTRHSVLLPNVWNFYYNERLFLLKLLQHIIQFKDDPQHKYCKEFKKIVVDIGLQELKESLLTQLDKVISTAPPSRKIQNDFSNETVRQEWAECNLREQLDILLNLLLIAEDVNFTAEEFNKLVKLFRKHGFGKSQGYGELLDESHKEACLKVMFVEVSLFLVIANDEKIEDLPSWIEQTKELVEFELTKLQVDEEHSAILIAWMLLTLKSSQHCKYFESQYQQFGVTALRLQLFVFLHSLLMSPVFKEKSKCSLIVRRHVFRVLGELCDRFDPDGTISRQPGAMALCAALLETEELAQVFWKLLEREDKFGVVSLWNTAMEYFPYDFSALSELAAGLAKAGVSSSNHLLSELSNLPVYTEVYNPSTTPVMTLNAEDAILSRDYCPLGNDTYKVETGSAVTIMERSEGTMIHFRTPYSYWTIFNHELELALDRKGQGSVNPNLRRVFEGSKVLKNVLQSLVGNGPLPKVLVPCSEGVFDVLVRFMRAESPPLPLLVQCLQICTILAPLYPGEIHVRLSNTGLLPRVLNPRLTPTEYCAGASLDSAAVGGYLVTWEVRAGAYHFLLAYIDLLCAFHEASKDERIAMEIILPGLILILHEVFPNIRSWRYANRNDRQDLLMKCTKFMTMVLEQTDKSEAAILLKKTCLQSLLFTENAAELLRIISIGNERLERELIAREQWGGVSATQRCAGVLMFVLRLRKLVADTEPTPLERLILSQGAVLQVVPKVTSYINHAFNKSLPVLCCRLLKKFADNFQMSLFASLDMTAYQVRVLFLDRLRDPYETEELKVAILDFVATCVATQPGLTEAFFMANYENKDKEDKKEDDNENFEGIMAYMAEYLGTIKHNSELLQCPLLGCIMSLFHALWKNNMQILVKKLYESPKFWEHLTSPLFSEIQPGLRTYAQIFNVLAIELFQSRENLDPNFTKILEQIFDDNEDYLNQWIEYIFSFPCRCDNEVVTDVTPVWLSLLTSWKDFTTIFCKCLPFTLNIAHKNNMANPCMNALLNELDEFKDGRLVVILAELYVVMLANWKEDCFDNRKASAKQIDNLLTNTAIVYECLHPRAVKAILSIGTSAISSLDYEIKANSTMAQSVIRSVTNINSIELEKLYEEIKEDKAVEVNKTDNIPPIVLSLALLEQCLDLYDDAFSGLSQWFQSTRFVNKLLGCLQLCLHKRQHYVTSLAGLRCLTAYARSCFFKELLMADVDQYLWLQLLPPKIDANGGPLEWKPEEWWRVYGAGLDFVSMMLMHNGHMFAGDAISFVGVHLDYLVEAILLPRQLVSSEAMDLCAATLNLVVQLVRFEARWRSENINSLCVIMRSISACLYQCVVIMLRCRRSLEPAPAAAASQTAVMHRTLEMVHMATLCLLSFSPPLLSLLADPALELDKYEPLVELHTGAPKISYEPCPQLTIGTLLAAIAMLTRSLNHSYVSEEWRGGRAGGRETRETRRSTSVSSVSSVASAHAALSEPLLRGALASTATLLAEQALLAVRDEAVPPRHRALVRRELASELASFHEFVRKRLLNSRPPLQRVKLGSWPLPPSAENPPELPPPTPPKRAAHDSMRQYILRKHYLDKCAHTPIKELAPVSHSTPAPDKKLRVSKRVSWAETTKSSEICIDDSESPSEIVEPVYSNLTDVHINSDDDYLHFMSVVFLYICQTEM